MDYTDNFVAQFYPLQMIQDLNPHYVDHEYEKDPYRDDSLYDKTNLQFGRDDYPPRDDEDEPVIEDNKISRALPP